MSLTKVRTRFAPSPTGFLHLGNARTAILSYLFARQKGGEWWLRIDDTDRERSTTEFTEGILEDLTWLGLAYDQKIAQSERFDRYHRAVQHLREVGRLYSCYETPDELAHQRDQARSQGRPPTYNRAALNLSDQERQDFEAQGRRPHWRFFLNHDVMKWHDLIRGPTEYDLRHLSDPVLVREDGSPIYTLASVVDDLETQMTHIMRGEDHVSNTAIQIHLYQALGGDPATLTFAHFPLIMDAKGEGFSKRLGSLGLRELRYQGILPGAVLAVLSALGTAKAPQHTNLKDLAATLDFSLFGRTSPRLDPQDLWAQNTSMLHEMPYDDVRPLLAKNGLSDVPPELWKAVHQNITHLDELRDWVQWRHQEHLHQVPSLAEEKIFLNQALELLPLTPWDETTWKTWTDAVAKATGRKGKSLFLPLRLALTGRSKGPEMRLLLPLLTRSCVERRLVAAGEEGPS